MISIVYDIDGVLNDLNKQVCLKLGIDVNILKFYNVQDNVGVGITQKQADEIQGLYRDIDFLKTVPLLDDVCGILDIEREFDCKVDLHSLSYTQEFADLKYRLLKEKLPNLRDDRIFLEVGTNKSTLDNIYILVEDSIDNIARSKACVRNVMIKQPNNNFRNYSYRKEDLNVKVAQDLKHAVQIVRQEVSRVGWRIA